MHDQALRTQLAAAEKKIQLYNDIIVSQASELMILRNGLCGNCRKRLTPLAATYVPSSCDPIPTSTSQSATASAVPPSQTLAVVTSTLGPIVATSNAKSSVTRTDTLSSLSPIPESKFYGAPETFAAPVTSLLRALPQPKLLPSVSRPPVPDYSAPQLAVTATSSLTVTRPLQSHKPSSKIASHVPSKRVDHPWSIANNPNVKLRLTYLRSFSFTDSVFCVKFSADGKHLAVGLADGSSGHLVALTAVGFTGRKNGKGFIYHVETGTTTCVLEEIVERVKSGIHSMCFSPNGEILAVGHYDGHISLWKIKGKRIRNMFRGHSAIVTFLEFSRNGRHLISASGNTVRVWSLRDGSSRTFINDSRLWAVGLSPNEQYFAAADSDKSLSIRALRTGKLVQKWTGISKGVTTLVFTPDGKGLVSGGDEKIKYWGVDLPEVRLQGTRGWPVGFSPTCRKREILEFNGHSSNVNCLAISPCGQWVLSGSLDQTACIWEARTGVHECTLMGHEEILSVDFSPMGNHLAIGSNRRASLWKYTAS